MYASNTRKKIPGIISTQEQQQCVDCNGCSDNNVASSVNLIIQTKAKRHKIKLKMGGGGGGGEGEVFDSLLFFNFLYCLSTASVCMNCFHLHFENEIAYAEPNYDYVSNFREI